VQSTTAMNPREKSLWTGHRARRDGLRDNLRAGIAPDSLRAGLADPPEDWTAASPCGAAAVITFQPKARFWLV